MSRREEAICDSSERLYWLNSPMCLEHREEQREEKPPLRLLAGLARKTGRALARMLGVKTR